MSIMDIAKTVRKVILERYPDRDHITIERTTTNDNRSYHINSEKITEVLGFIPEYSVEDAVVEMCEAFSSGKLPDSFDEDNYYNIRTMKKLAIK